MDGLLNDRQQKRPLPCIVRGRPILHKTFDRMACELASLPGKGPDLKPGSDENGETICLQTELVLAGFLASWRCRQGRKRLVGWAVAWLLDGGDGLTAGVRRLNHPDEEDAQRRNMPTLGSKSPCGLASGSRYRLAFA